MKKSVYFSTGFVLFLGLVILWIPWLGETLFYSKGEPREAVVAVSMLQQGNWVLPVSVGTDIPYKPPFLAWIIAALAWLFNGGEVNEFISRLPSAVAAIALVMATFSWAKKIRGEQFAVVIALVLATSVEFYRAASACRVDMVLTACMVGAMYLIYEVKAHEGRDNFWRYLLATLLLSGATLTKGPIGVLLPCLVMGVYLLLSGERFFPTLGRMTALCVASCIIPTIWYYYAWTQGGQPFLQLVWEENFQRLAGTMSYESHVKPFWYNFVTLAVGMLPWTLLMVMALFAIRHFVSQPLKPAGRLALTAAVIIFVFYCIPSSKRSVYLLPMYPFVAYFVASLAESLTSTRINTSFMRVLAIIAIAVPVIALATMYYPVMEFRFEPQSWWSYIVLFLPMVVGIAWLMRRIPDGTITGACIIAWSIYVAYGGALMPAILNPLSDKDNATMLESIADGRTVYAMRCESTTVLPYSINYYMGDKMRQLTSAEAADTLPKGSVIIFTNLADTAGLPDTYHLTLLSRRLSDTRRAALFAVQTGTPVVRHKLNLNDDSLRVTLPADTIVPAPPVAKPRVKPDTTSRATRNILRVIQDSSYRQQNLPIGHRYNRSEIDIIK